MNKKLTDQQYKQYIKECKQALVEIDKYHNLTLDPLFNRFEKLFEHHLPLDSLRKWIQFIKLTDRMFSDLMSVRFDLIKVAGALEMQSQGFDYPVGTGGLKLRKKRRKSKKPCKKPWWI